ncbi:hypothetical protein [Mycolicibacterium sp.]|uniref:hypothetical protein n=1 Tax=Mycolicibacterium sp. TaxID=2320850 RepID=UPI00355CD4A5
MIQTSTARKLAAAAVAFALIGAATACDSQSPEGPTATQDPTTTTSATSTAVEPFTAFVEPVEGTEGLVTYQAELPQLRGGDPAVRERFNTGMRAALDDYLVPTEDNTPVSVWPGVLGEDDRSEVTHIGTGSVAGVLLLNISVERAAHPFNAVATTVIDAQTAEPIMITDLFTDQTAGLTALVDGINAEIAEDEKLAGQSAPEPVADQLTAWVPDDDGLVVFVPVAHVLGDYYPITVDWDVLDPVLAPGMRETLTD